MSEWRPHFAAVNADTLPELLKQNPAVVLHFWASWCDYCQKLDCLLQLIQSEQPSELTVLSVSVDDAVNRTLAADWNVTTLPLLTCHIQGAMTDRLTEGLKHIAGLRQEHRLRNKLQQWNEQAAHACASDRHKAIVQHLLSRLRRDDRSGFSASAVTIMLTGLKTYPDVTVTCGEPYYHPLDTNSLINPMVLFEVLSPSTEGYDRGEKWASYRQLDSLQEYVLVSQHTPLVEVYARQDDGAWKFTAADALDGSVSLPSLGMTLSLAEVYEKIAFDPPVPVPDLEEETPHEPARN